MAAGIHVPVILSHYDLFLFPFLDCHQFPIKPVNCEYIVMPANTTTVIMMAASFAPCISILTNSQNAFILC